MTPESFTRTPPGEAIMIYGWKTQKTPQGFKASVYRHDGGPNEILNTATFATREKATSFAKKWALYYRVSVRRAKVAQ